MKNHFVVLCLIVLEVSHGVLGMKLSCNKDGEFFRLVTVFDRNTGFVAGVKVECNQGSVATYEDNNVQQYSDGVPIGVTWTAEINPNFEYKPAACPSDHKMKGFSVWRIDTATVGIQVVCNLPGSKDDYYIDLYSDIYREHVGKSSPTATKICADAEFVDEFDVDPWGNIINLTFKCYGQEALDLSTPTTEKNRKNNKKNRKNNKKNRNQKSADNQL